MDGRILGYLLGVRATVGMAGYEGPPTHEREHQCPNFIDKLSGHSPIAIKPNSQG